MNILPNLKGHNDEWTNTLIVNRTFIVMLILLDPTKDKENKKWSKSMWRRRFNEGMREEMEYEDALAKQRWIEAWERVVKGREWTEMRKSPNILSI